MLLPPTTTTSDDTPIPHNSAQLHPATSTLQPSDGSTSRTTEDILPLPRYTIPDFTTLFTIYTAHPSSVSRTGTTDHPPTNRLLFGIGRRRPHRLFSEIRGLNSTSGLRQRTVPNGTVRMRQRRRQEIRRRPTPVGPNPTRHENPSSKTIRWTQSPSRYHDAVLPNTTPRDQRRRGLIPHEAV